MMDPYFNDPPPRRFKIIRHMDVSGVSGVGRVADGIQFWTGQCVICWRTDKSSIAMYDSLGDLEHIHGHDGSSEIEWIDP